MRSEDVKEHGLSAEKARSMVRLSEFYWVGTESQWSKIKSNFTFEKPLTETPKDDLTRIMVIYHVKGPNKRIGFRKGNIMVFCQNNVPSVSDGKMYLHPKMEGNIMKYGFKSE